jgi:hypothetical protein
MLPPSLASAVPARLPPQLRRHLLRRHARGAGWSRAGGADTQRARAFRCSAASGGGGGGGGGGKVRVEEPVSVPPLIVTNEKTTNNAKAKPSTEGGAGAMEAVRAWLGMPGDGAVERLSVVCAHCNARLTPGEMDYDCKRDKLGREEAAASLTRQCTGALVPYEQTVGGRVHGPALSLQRGVVAAGAGAGALFRDLTFVP